MTYGTLNEAQALVLAGAVKGMTVTDLGAGSCEHAKLLIQWGAKEVIAVDREVPRESPHERITLVESQFHNYHEPVDVVFVSWPVNWAVSLRPILERARVIIYLGSNVHGNACGEQYDVWDVLTHREILAHEPDARNTLTIYSDKYTDRPATGEELASANRENIMMFDEAEAQSNFKLP